MAIQLDNLDSIIKGLAKLEKAVETEVVREARKRMRATIRKYIPVFKKITPVKSGDMAKSVKVQSRSRRGLSTVKLVWDMKAKKKKEPEVKPTFQAFGIKATKKTKEKESKPVENYAGFANFKPNQSAEGFASDEFKRKKSALDKQGTEDVRESFKQVFNKFGIKFK